MNQDEINKIASTMSKDSGLPVEVEIVRFKFGVPNSISNTCTLAPIAVPKISKNAKKPPKTMGEYIAQTNLSELERSSGLVSRAFEEAVLSLVEKSGHTSLTLTEICERWADVIINSNEKFYVTNFNPKFKTPKEWLVDNLRGNRIGDMYNNPKFALFIPNRITPECVILTVGKYKLWSKKFRYSKSGTRNAKVNGPFDVYKGI